MQWEKGEHLFFFSASRDRDFFPFRVFGKKKFLIFEYEIRECDSVSGKIG
jgi:hypothetical protein